MLFPGNNGRRRLDTKAAHRPPLRANVGLAVSQSCRSMFLPIHLSAGLIFLPRLPFPFTLYSSSMKTEILLICNAQTLSDPKDRTTGWWSDLSLSPDGRRQAMLLGERLKTKYEDIEFLYASPLKRSAEMAAILADTLKVVARKDAGLRELDPGTIDPGKDDRGTAPDFGAGTPGNGESYESLHRRATRAIDAIITRCLGKRVIIVTHGGPIVAYLRAFLGFGPGDSDRAPFFGCIPSSLHELIVDDSEKTIVRLNDVSHLADAPH
jgi:broad specificity phosphatase PhoE